MLTKIYEKMRGLSRRSRYLSYDQLNRKQKAKAYDLAQLDMVRCIYGENPLPHCSYATVGKIITIREGYKKYLGGREMSEIVKATMLTSVFNQCHEELREAIEKIAEEKKYPRGF